MSNWLLKSTLLITLIACGEKKERKLDKTGAAQAEFPGGLAELYSFIANEIEYPAYCRENGIQGKVYISFVINTEGYPEDIKVKKSVHPLLDQEAMRAISVMPRWEPGMMNGGPVKSRFTLPINFKTEVMEEKVRKIHHKPIRKPSENAPLVPPNQAGSNQ